VPYEETFGFFAERMLEESGVPARVLNLGVGGYGMDQALLRFRRDGAALAPDVVVFGFQAENTHRNRNLVRPLYQPSTGLPFSKPRFVLEDGRLRVINVPPLPPGEIVETLRSFGDWDLAPYDEFYVPGDRAPIWWRRSRLLAVAADLLGPNPWAPDFDPEGASGRLALAIGGAFSEEVRALGARFVILHLPLRETVRSAASGRPPKYAALLAALHARYEVVDPLSRLVEAARDPGVGPLYTLHFTAAGNRVVAGALVPHLEAAAGEASRPEAAGRVRAAGGPLR
jgi:hypothetical protein